MKTFVVFVWITLILPLVSGKVQFLVNGDEATDCTKPEESPHVYDFRDLEIVHTSDTEMFVNGSIRFLKDIDSPWQERHYTEKFDRGQWNLALVNTQFQDFCPRIKSPTEAWHFQMRHLPGCPIKAGMTWDFDMVPMNKVSTLPPVLPRDLIGQYRAFFISEFLIDGVKKYHCNRVDFEFTDV